MKAVIYICLLIGFMTSCRSYSYIKDYNLEVNKSRLPKLTPITDQSIFAEENNTIYDASYVRTLGTASNIHLIERQFTKYVLENLTSPRTNKYGYAVMRINHLNVRNELPLLSVLAAGTLGLSTLVGIPAGNMTAELDLSLEILDVNQKIIDIYNGRASNSAIIGAYYGYGDKGARDKSLYEAVESCLNQINAKLMRDFDRLESNLVETAKAKPIEEK